MDHLIDDDEMDMYRRLLAEASDEAQRRQLLLLIACRFEQDELATGAGLKSVADSVRGSDFTRLH